jgi:hypothetical protein
MSRRHREHLTSSLLGPRDRFVKIPLVLRVGIWFGVGVSRRRFMEELLGDTGHDSPEDLRDLFNHPPRRLMARPAPDHFSPKDVRLEKPEVILREALILGLATGSIYDPLRPVIWTEASLSRRLELYDPGSFYQ